MQHVLQHSYGRITHAYKGENHLATFEIRATLLRVNTTLCNVARLFVRPSPTTDLKREVLPLNFRGDLMRPFCRIKQMRCIVQRKRQDVRIAKFAIAKCFKAVGSELWQGLKISKYIIYFMRMVMWSISCTLITFLFAFFCIWICTLMGKECCRFLPPCF